MTPFEILDKVKDPWASALSLFFTRFAAKEKCMDCDISNWNTMQCEACDIKDYSKEEL